MEIGGDVHLSVAVSGNRMDRTLLFIPGLGTSSAVFATLFKNLEGDFMLIAMDSRGIGDSSPLPQVFSMEEMGDDVARLIGAMGLSRAVVAGFSMGGLVAQYAAIRHPGMVSALILGCTHPGYAHGVAPPDEIDDALRGRGAHTPEEAYRRATTVLYSERFRLGQPDLLEAHVAERLAHPVRGLTFSAQYNAARAADPFSGLASIQCPTLVLHGGQDLVVPVENASLLADQITGSRLAVEPGAGHLFFHENPGWTARQIETFLGEAEARGVVLSAPV